MFFDGLTVVMTLWCKRGGISAMLPSSTINRNILAIRRGWVNQRRAVLEEAPTYFETISTVIPIFLCLKLKRLTRQRMFF